MKLVTLESTVKWRTLFDDELNCKLKNAVMINCFSFIGCILAGGLKTRKHLIVLIVVIKPQKGFDSLFVNHRQSK